MYHLTSMFYMCVCVCGLHSVDQNAHFTSKVRTSWSLGSTWGLKPGFEVELRSD